VIILATFDDRSKLVAVKHFATQSDPLLDHNGRFPNHQPDQPRGGKQHWRQHDEQNAGDHDVECSLAKSA
jgi:hypothetical protein